MRHPREHAQVAEVEVARAAALGGRLADGIEAAAADHGLDWRAHRLRNRSGITHAPRMPRDAREAPEARETFDKSCSPPALVSPQPPGPEAIDSAGRGRPPRRE